MINNKITPRLIFTTLVAILGVVVLVRLGIWQLDRLDSRREFNTHYINQISLPTIDINENRFYPQLINSEYRQAIASGQYDFENEIFLQNQAYGDQPGYRVLTPFILSDGGEVLYVERGWIGLEDIDRIEEIDSRSKGNNQISGVIRLSQQKNSYGIDPDKDKDPSSRFWLIVNLDKLQKREDRLVLPVYIQIIEKMDDGLPYPVPNEIEISEGPHMGYAIQWFFFASLLAIGYPFFVRKTMLKTKAQKEIIDDDY